MQTIDHEILEAAGIGGALNSSVSICGVYGSWLHATSLA